MQSAHVLEIPRNPSPFPANPILSTLTRSSHPSHPENHHHSRTHPLSSSIAHPIVAATTRILAQSSLPPASSHRPAHGHGPLLSITTSIPVDNHPIRLPHCTVYLLNNPPPRRAIPVATAIRNLPHLTQHTRQLGAVPPNNDSWNSFSAPAREMEASILYLPRDGVYRRCGFAPGTSLLDAMVSGWIARDEVGG